MQRWLGFRFVSFDTRTVFPGPHWTEFFIDENHPGHRNITATGEEETLRWILRSPAKNLLLNELQIVANPFAAYSVGKPLIEDPQKKPGDIDLLLCDPQTPNCALALQGKRVKVTAEGPDNDKINKLEKLGDAVVQSNGTRDLGFHRTYLAVLIGADSRLRQQIPVQARLANSGTFQRIYDFPQRDSLHDDVGVVFIEISQPTGKNFDETAIVAVAVDREAARLEQRAIMTDKVRKLMRQSSARC